MRFHAKLEAKIKAYRDMRRKQTGKVMFRETALNELLLKALDGVEPPKPIDDRLAAIEKRLSVLEGGSEG